MFELVAESGKERIGINNQNKSHINDVLQCSIVIGSPCASNRKNVIFAGLNPRCFTTEESTRRYYGIGNE